MLSSAINANNIAKNPIRDEGDDKWRYLLSMEFSLLRRIKVKRGVKI
jgi:hypothetical protein